MANHCSQMNVSIICVDTAVCDQTWKYLKHVSSLFIFGSVIAITDI